MSEDSQASSSGQKQYWHDRRIEASHNAAPSTGQMADQLSRHGSQQAAGPVVTAPPLRTIPNLRHPIAAFVLLILVVIFLGVGVLGASGQGALPAPPVHLADCARPTAPVLGAPGAQFTVVSPAGAQLGGEGSNFCLYEFSDHAGDAARPLGFNVGAFSKPVGVSSGGQVGTAPDWAAPSEITHVSRNGANGSETFRCEENLDRCQGWLRVSRGRATWLVSAGGNGASLPRIEAFLNSFQPAG